MNMNNCPCCSQPMLRYIRREGIYWFCTSCWQEMPDLASLINAQKQQHQRDFVKLSSIKLEIVSTSQS